MAVFTPIDNESLNGLLQSYGFKPPFSHQGIEGGAENSNFFVQTAKHSLVLTLFETLNSRELEWYLTLYQRLFAAGFAVPQVWACQQGRLCQQVAGKPATIMSRVNGRHLTEVKPAHAQAIGTFLGQLHRQGPLISKRKPQYHLAWCQKQNWAQNIPLYQQAIQISEQFCQLDLPSGLTHADLFRDNALFNGKQLSGVLDWFFACHQPFIMDLAICLDDWCQGEAELEQQMLIAYQQERALSDLELDAIPMAKVFAMLGFWLKRKTNEQLYHQGLRNMAKPSSELANKLEQQLEILQVRRPSG